MKHKAIIKLYSDIKSISGHSGEEFVHRIAKNRKKLLIEVEILNERREEIEKDLEEFNNKQQAISEKYASRDKTGELIRENETQYSDGRISFTLVFTPENEEKNKLEIKALREEYKDTLDSYDNKIKEYNIFLNTKDSDFVPIMLKKEHIPKTLTEQDCFKIIDLIED
jgi:chromosome segregation ATPase